MGRYRVTIILLVVAAALVAAVFLLPSSGPNGTANATPTPTTNVFGAGNTDPITAIEVVSGTERISVQQDVSGTTWSLLEPVKAEADSFTISNIVDQLKTLQPTDTITQTTNLSDFGLDKPKMTITLKFGGSKPGEYKLLVGDQTPDVASYYTKIDGRESVYIISNGLIEPMKSWLDTPPIAQPTATPMPITVLPPADTPTPTVEAAPSPPQ